MGIFNQVLGHDISFLHSNDQSGRVFWFVVEKMDKVYQSPNIPRFSDDDAVALAQRSLSVRMNDKVKFADLWENRLAYRLVSYAFLQEIVLCDRLMDIGRSPWKKHSLLIGRGDVSCA